MTKPVDQTELWQGIEAMPDEIQHRIGQLFVGNKQWAQSVLAARNARLLALAQSQKTAEQCIDAFWQNRTHMICGC